MQTLTSCLDYLQATFEIVPLDEALHAMSSGTLRGRCAALTFDDGDSSIADYVEPILRERELPATFFINSAYLDGRRSYWFPVLAYLQQAGAQLEHLTALEDAALTLRNTGNHNIYNELRGQFERLAPQLPGTAHRVVGNNWLSKLDGEQFAIGLHGHEHQRFSMMSAEWQRTDLETNIEMLSQFRAFRAIFALPFGRAHDWTPTTLSIAHDLRLEMLLADGGVNVGPAECYLRQPGDEKPGSRAFAEALANCRSLEKSSP